MMQSNYFHKGCNKTVRKFYEDFDLLPRDAKALIWDSPTSPDFDDLKTAWEIAGENFSIENLLKLNCYEEERKAKAIADSKAKREAKIRERRDRHMAKYTKRGHYVWNKVDHSDDKHERLIKRVTEEEAMKLLNTRNETKDIKPVSGWVRTWVPETPNTKAEKELKFMEFEPKQHICKMLHNSGGKK